MTNLYNFRAKVLSAAAAFVISTTSILAAIGPVSV
jgi:hypothetical protein